MECCLKDKIGDVETMGKVDILEKFHCTTCGRVLKVAGIFIQNDESGTSTIMYDCPVCGKTDIRNRLGDVMSLTEKLPKESFISRVRYMTDLVERTDKILSKMEHKPSLKLYYGGLA